MPTSSLKNVLQSFTKSGFYPELLDLGYLITSMITNAFWLSPFVSDRYRYERFTYVN